MIFVIVGHHPEGFERLVKKLDEIAPEIDEQIILQAGFARNQPHSVSVFSFKPYEEVLQLMREARVVLCHCGACVIDALLLGKPLIVVPRLKKYNEAINDHQAILAERLKKEGKVEVVYDMNDLKKFLMQSYQEKPLIDRDNKLVSYLRKQVDKMLGAS